MNDEQQDLVAAKCGARTNVACLSVLWAEGGGGRRKWDVSLPRNILMYKNDQNYVRGVSPDVNIIVV
jgi:hypothetical protein